MIRLSFAYSHYRQFLLRLAHSHLHCLALQTTLGTDLVQRINKALLFLSKHLGQDADVRHTAIPAVGLEAIRPAMAVDRRMAPMRYR